MSTFIKPLFALLISILFISVFSFLADSELLEYVRTHLYNPSILNLYEKENSLDAGLAENHINELQKKFAETLTNPSVSGSFLYNQNAEDIFQRSRIFGILLESTSGLQAVQFVDNNGIRIHYSTSPRDIISQNENSTSYRNYSEDPYVLPYETVSIPAGGAAKFTMDQQTDRIIFSFPFNDSMDVYRGTALFTVSVRALAEMFIAEGRLKINEDITVISSPAGILLGSPVSYKADIHEKVSSVWNGKIQERMPQIAVSSSRTVIDAEESGVKYSLVSLRTPYGLFFGRLVNDDLFSIPDSMKLILRLSIYLTFYLTLLFLISFKPNAVTLVQNRIRNLRESLFEQLYVNKTGQERTKWIFELEQRREEISRHLKRGLRLKPVQEKNIDSIIDKSWNELLSVIKSGGGADITVTQETISPALAIQKSKVEKIEEVEELEEIEEAEAIDDAEELEEIEEAEAIDDAEELEEIEEAEAIDEVEELEEIEEAEELEEIEEAEAIDDAEELEEIEEAEELDGAEELEEIEEAEAQDEIIESVPVHFKQTEKIEKPKKEHGLLALASKYAAERLTRKGLLVSASKYAAEKLTGKGLLALASEIEFNNHNEENEKQFEQDTFTDLDIVSPFSSMFSSLEENKQ